MNEVRARFFSELRSRYPGISLDARIFHFLLDKYIPPNYTPQRATQDCLFIGPGPGEATAVKDFLKRSYDIEPEKVVTIGTRLEPMPLCKPEFDYFSETEFSDARYSTVFDAEVLPVTRSGELDLIVVRRPITPDERHMRGLSMILDNCFNYLSNDGRLITTSGLYELEADNLRKVVEASHLKSILSTETTINDKTTFRDMGWDTEQYIFIGSK